MSQRKNTVYFRINVRNTARLSDARAFARRLRLSGIRIDDWFFEQVELYKRREPETLKDDFLTVTGVIDLAKKKYDLKLRRIDLTNWRNKAKLPKLREKFDYIRQNGRILYKKAKMDKFFRAFLEKRVARERKAEEESIVEQTFLTSRNALPVVDKKDMRVQSRFVPIRTLEDNE